MLPSVLRTGDFSAIEAVFEMKSGYVLNFTNRTFSLFFDQLGIDIDKMFPDGSKATRLRAFLQHADHSVAARVLGALMEHRGRRESDDQSVDIAKIRSLIARLSGVRVESIRSTAQGILSLEYVRELETKIDQRLETADFEGAITTARTMVEAVLEELERQLLESLVDHKGDLQQVFKAVAKALRMDDQRTDIDDNFKQVARGLVQIINGLAPLRNKLSDAHPRRQRPVAHHARLIVNAAKTVAFFMVESYMFQKEKAESGRKAH